MEAASISCYKVPYQPFTLWSHQCSLSEKKNFIGVAKPWSSNPLSSWEFRLFGWLLWNITPVGRRINSQFFTFHWQFLGRRSWCLWWILWYAGPSPISIKDFGAELLRILLASWLELLVPSGIALVQRLFHSSSPSVLRPPQCWTKNRVGKPWPCQSDLGQFRRVTLTRSLCVVAWGCWWACRAPPLPLCPYKLPSTAANPRHLFSFLAFPPNDTS